MKMAVLYLHKGGGIGQFTYELVRSMLPLAEITCYLAEQNRLLDQFQSLPCASRVFPMQRGKKALAKALLTGREPSGIADAIFAGSPDVVLDTGSVWWSSVIARQIGRRIPFAQIVHDVTPHPGPLHVAERMFGRLFAPAADAFIALSHYSYLELQKRFPGATLIESRHGIMLAQAGTDPATIASKRNKLLFFGSISRYKGVDVLLEAYAIARSSNPALELHICGSGKLDADVLRRIRALGVSLRNEYIPESEVGDVILTHGLLVLPYTSATQSGVAAVALANGLPAIATNVGALPEQIIDGRNGLVVPPNDPRALADAILKLSSNAEMAQAMSEQSLLVGRELYSWSEIGPKLLRDIQSALLAGKSCSVGSA